MRIRVYVSVGLAGCRREEVLEIPDEELEGLDSAARTGVMESYAEQWKDDTVEWDWHEEVL